VPSKIHGSEALDRANYLGIKWRARTPRLQESKDENPAGYGLFGPRCQQPALAASAAPQKGGTVTYAVTAQAPTTDCHANTTYAVIHVLAPHFAAKVDAENYPKLKPDVAESWNVSPDGLT
jgi:hypothetical protein